MRFDDQTREHYRRLLLDKGFAIAQLLAAVLAGKDKQRDIAALPVFSAKPGMTPEEKLRAFLALIEARRELLVAGDERFGCCEYCGVELGELELEEMAWADRCQACAAKL